MICPRCKARYEGTEGRCPQCGSANPDASGTYQTSTVLISMAGSARVYRSVDDVPAALRTQLLKSTNGANSATILIADRRGRREIAKAMRNLPGSAQRRLRAMVGQEAQVGLAAWFNPARRKTFFFAGAGLLLAAVALVLSRAG